MPLVAAAVCPHPPILVPQVAAGAAAELDDLRAACDAAVTGLAGSGATSLLVLGADRRTAEYAYPFRGSFTAWGLPLQVTIGRPTAEAEQGRVPREGAVREGQAEQLPLSLLVGAWLLSRAALPGVEVRMATVAGDAAPERCARLGEGLGSSAPWALLVMGDGSACRGLKSPGYDDQRAGPYDATVARALAEADPATLLDLDPGLSAELKVAGRAPWQVLAAAVRATGRRWRGELTYDAAPYGVAYLVASWTPA